MPLVGGLQAEAKAADDKVKEICEKVKADVEAKLNKKFLVFTPLSFKSQLVNGVNYFIKVLLDEGRYCHLRVHQAFDGTTTLADVQDNLDHHDEIKYF